MREWRNGRRAGFRHQFPVSEGSTPFSRTNPPPGPSVRRFFLSRRRPKEDLTVYTIGEMAKMLGVPASTLRYYDKEGLLPFVARSSGGIRQFRESDIEWLRVIGCMKKAGMSIKDIRQELKQQPEG